MSTRKTLGPSKPHPSSDELDDYDYTAEEIAAMSDEEYEAKRADVRRAIDAGRVYKPRRKGRARVLGRY